MSKLLTQPGSKRRRLCKKSNIEKKPWRPSGKIVSDLEVIRQANEVKEHIKELAGKRKENRSAFLVIDGDIAEAKSVILVASLKDSMFHSKEII